MAVFDAGGAFTEVITFDVRYNEKLNVSMDFESLGGVSMQYLYLTDTAIYDNVDFAYITDYLLIEMDIEVRCVSSECSGESGGRTVSWDRTNNTCVGKDNCRDTCYCITRYAAGLESYQDSGIESRITIGALVVVCIMIFFVFVGIVHCKTGILSISGMRIFHNHDDFDFKSILGFCFQLWDFSSDLLLCYSIYDHWYQE